jgi:hypothetical protein
LKAGDVFKTVIPLTAKPGEHASAHADEHGETQKPKSKILF